MSNARELIGNLCEDKASTLPRDIVRAARKHDGKLIASPMIGNWTFNFYGEDQLDRAHVFGKYVQSRHSKSLNLSYSSSGFDYYRVVLDRVGG